MLDIVKYICDFNNIETRLNTYQMFDVYEMLRSHVPQWNCLDTSAIVISPLIGGLSNEIYVAKADSPLLPPDAPKRAVIRIISPRVGADVAAYADFRKSESTLLRQLAQKALFPSVYHEFEYGRLEPFIAGKNPTMAELKTRAFSDLLVPILAQLHCLEKPVTTSSFENSEFCIVVKNFLRELEIAPNSPAASPNLGRAPRPKLTEIRTDPGAISRGKAAWVLNGFRDQTERVCSDSKKENAICSPQRLNAELRWLCKRQNDLMAGRQSFLAFCHNDLQEGNFLVSGAEAGARLQLIDFEYAGRNPPAYDLGNFLAECYIDNFYDEGDGFRVARELFPTDAEIAAVAARYLAALRERTRGDERFDGVALETDPGRFAGEVRLGMLCSHFFWALWGAAMAGRTDVSWNFGAYARARMGEFYRLKREWFGEQ